MNYFKYNKETEDKFNILLMQFLSNKRDSLYFKSTDVTNTNNAKVLSKYISYKIKEDGYLKICEYKITKYKESGIQNFKFLASTKYYHAMGCEKL